MAVPEGWSKDMTRLVNERLRSGQKFLGAINGGGDVELVFDMPEGARFNLVSIGPRHGIQVGFVSEPEAYVDPERNWIDETMGED
jgi:hypothetical protein